MKKKGGILNGTEKMGSKELQEKTVILQKWTGKKNGKHIDPKKKGGILNRTEKMGSKELQEKKGHLTQMDWEKKWEANRSTKKLAS